MIKLKKYVIAKALREDEVSFNYWLFLQNKKHNIFNIVSFSELLNNGEFDYYRVLVEVEL